MTKKEIFDSEKENLKNIYLYKEGIFWKAYERSAFNFCKHVTAFKPTKKFIKTVGYDVVSIGFPTANLDKHKDKFQIVEQTETQMTLAAETITHNEFELWKKSTQYNTHKNRSKMQTDILEQIKAFNVESKTPMECMKWVAELKEQLNI